MNRFKYFGNGLDIWETSLDCGERLRYVKNDLNMWEITWICGKRLKYVGNDLYLGNGLKLKEMA